MASSRSPGAVHALQDAIVRLAALPLGRSRLLILTYHRVLPLPDALLPDDIDAAAFAWQMQLLSSQFNVLPLPEAAARLQAGQLPPRAASVSFDDGYANNFTVALPLLNRYGVPATFFISTGYLDGGRMWNDGIIEAVRATRKTELDLADCGLGRWPTASEENRRVAAQGIIDAVKYRETAERERLVERVIEASGAQLPRDLMMSSAQVNELARSGMDIGAHTVTHPILSRIEPRDAEREIRAGRDRLREITGNPIAVFAYPNGRPGRDYTSAHVAMVRDAGFTAAVSTAWGAASRSSQALQLPRVAPWDRTRLRFSLRLLSACLEKPESVNAPNS